MLTKAGGPDGLRCVESLAGSPSLAGTRQSKLESGGDGDAGADAWHAARRMQEDIMAAK
jgi:hypothetical protein